MRQVRKCVTSATPRKYTLLGELDEVVEVLRFDFVLDPDPDLESPKAKNPTPDTDPGPES